MDLLLSLACSPFMGPSCMSPGMAHTLLRGCGASEETPAEAPPGGQVLTGAGRAEGLRLIPHSLRNKLSPWVTASILAGRTRELGSFHAPG